MHHSLMANSSNLANSVPTAAFRPSPTTTFPCSEGVSGECDLASLAYAANPYTEYLLRVRQLRTSDRGRTKVEYVCVLWSLKGGPPSPHLSPSLLGLWSEGLDSNKLGAELKGPLLFGPNQTCLGQRPRLTQ